MAKKIPKQESGPNCLSVMRYKTIQNVVGKAPWHNILVCESEHCNTANETCCKIYLKNDSLLFFVDAIDDEDRRALARRQTLRASFSAEEDRLVGKLLT